MIRATIADGEGWERTVVAETQDDARAKLMEQLDAEMGEEIAHESINEYGIIYVEEQ